MPQVEVSLPDQTESEINRLVEQGEFINRDQAIEELLSRGLSAYDTVEETTSEIDDDIFGQVTDEQQDPAMRNDNRGDERTL